MLFSAANEGWNDSLVATLWDRTEVECDEDEDTGEAEFSITDTDRRWTLWVNFTTSMYMTGGSSGSWDSPPEGGDAYMTDLDVEGVFLDTPDGDNIDLQDAHDFRLDGVTYREFINLAVWVCEMQVNAEHTKGYKGATTPPKELPEPLMKKIEGILSDPAVKKAITSKGLGI